MSTLHQSAGSPAAPGAGAPKPSVPWCPSTHGADGQALVFAVVEGTVDAPRATYLRRSLPLVAVRHLSTGVQAEEVFRIAAPCAQSECVHFENAACSLARRAVEELDPVAELPPRCAIRSHCRWWAEQGVAACRRCPQVVTVDYAPDAHKLKAANPGYCGGSGPLSSDDSANAGVDEPRLPRH